MSNVDNLENMSEDELDAELRSHGVDPEKMIQDAFQKVCVALRAKSEEAQNLRDGLISIANSPHRAYDGNAPYVSEHSSGYALGVADGHRCAANTARAALAKADGKPTQSPAPNQPASPREP